MLLSGKRPIVLLLLLTFSLLVRAQETAPYSRFGLGLVDNSAFTASKGFGGLGAAYRDPLHINFINPASYTGLSLTTLEAGVNFTTKTIEDGTTGKKYRAGDGFVDYIALGFPVGKRAGVSFGMIPYSEMNYSFTQTAANATGSVEKLFDGSGRTYQLYAGGAYRFPKIDTLNNMFSIGLNATYIFGTLNRRDIIQFSPVEYYNTRVTTSARMSNVALNAGLQYKRKFNKTKYALIGAYSYFPIGVGSTLDETWERYVRISTGTFVIDSVYNENGDVKDMKIPVEVGGGITFGDQGRWQVGGEFRYKVWSEVESFSPNVTMKDSWEARVGTEWRAKSVPTSGFFKRMTYRAGGFYDKGYLDIGGQRISEFGGTFGFAMPLKISFSTLNFSFDVGSRGTTTENLVKETFFRAYIGFTFNDKWFNRPKYD